MQSAPSTADAYNRAVAAVAVRTFHEVFEADRREYVKTVSVTVKTTTINAATGLDADFVLIRAVADRSEFTRFDWAHIDPAETLTTIRSSVSTNAFGLEPVSRSRGIR